MNRDVETPAAFVPPRPLAADPVHLADPGPCTAPSAPDPAALDPAALDHRRRDAIAAARAEADGVDGHAVTAAAGGTGGIGVRSFAPGRLVLALAGRFDGAGLDRLRALAPALERQTGAELVVDLSGLRRCDAVLARIIGRLRIRRLADDARVEVHDPPSAVRRELGERPDALDPEVARDGNRVDEVAEVGANATGRNARAVDSVTPARRVPDRASPGSPAGNGHTSATDARTTRDTEETS